MIFIISRTQILIYNEDYDDIENNVELGRSRILMGYFREIPDIEYQSPFNSNINSSYVLAKNIFKKMKIRDDLQDVFTIFNKYIIREGQRPDTLGRGSLWKIRFRLGNFNFCQYH